MNKQIVTPKPLGKGSLIAIVCPASAVKAEYIHGACRALEDRGFRVKVMPHALGCEVGSYAAPVPDRVSDLKEVLQDPQVEAILCGRGGYGCVHLLDFLPSALVADNPKWLIGFSDISVLHALWHHAGVASLHASMCKHLTLEPPEDECTQLLMDLLTMRSPEISYREPSGPGYVAGEAEGVLLGGNLAVLEGLVGTPWDVLSARGEDVILMLEDVGEAIYRSERLLYQLHLSGALSRIKGLILGQFNDTRADKNFETAEQMAGERIFDWKLTCPVATNFPAGHIRRNLPLPLGQRVRLTVSPAGETALTTTR